MKSPARHLALAAALLPLAADLSHAGERCPNVLFIAVDDLNH